VVIAEVLLIVGNGVEAGNRAPSHSDQLSTRSKHTPKKIGDVGNVPYDRYPQVRHHLLPSISTCKQHDGNGSSYST
jgi:hypothetical protein